MLNRKNSIRDKKGKSNKDQLTTSTLTSNRIKS